METAVTDIPIDAPAPETPRARYGLLDPVTGDWHEVEVVPLATPSLLVLRDDTEGISQMALALGLQALVDHLKPNAVGAIHLTPGQEIAAVDDAEMHRLGYVRVEALEAAGYRRVEE